MTSDKAGFRIAATEWVKSTLAFILFPNAPFIIARQFIFLERPIFNFDYVFLALVRGLFSKKVNLLLFAAVFVLDVFLSGSGIFHFPVGDAIRSLADVPSLAPLILIPLVFPVVLVTIITVRCANSRWHSGTPLPWHHGLVLILLLAVPQATSVAYASLRGGMRMRTTFCSSSLSSFTFLVAKEFWPKALSPGEFWSKNSASKDLVVKNATITPEFRNIAFIVVESMGKPHDAAVMRLLEAPFHSHEITKRYRVNSGFVDFQGSTVSAELRELCGIQGGFREVRLDAAQFSPCLPVELSRQGYRTVAIHGFTRNMFNRWRWYPKLGFREQIFLENWPPEFKRRCGSLFVGICDDDAAALVGKELRTERAKQFIYWLTLDSHLQHDGAVHFDCQRELPSVPSEVCEIIQKQRHTLSRIAEIAADPALPPTQFIVVGDHSPPFFHIKSRSLFSDYSVPFFELLPRYDEERHLASYTAARAR